MSSGTGARGRTKDEQRSTHDGVNADNEQTSRFKMESDDSIHNNTSDICCSGTLTSFCKTGKIPQVDYANTCASKGEPTVGIVAQNGVVIVTEKQLINSLVESSSIRKLAMIDDHMAMGYSGLEPDFRQVSKQAKKLSLNHLVAENRPIPVNVLILNLCDILQAHTQTRGVRPFGVELLISGWQKNRGYLYKMDCIGAFLPVKAAAIGRNALVCNTYLERNHSNDILMEAAICLAIQTLKLACGNNSLGADQMDIGFVDEKGFKKMSETEIEYVLSHLR